MQINVAHKAEPESETSVVVFNPATNVVEQSVVVGPGEQVTLTAVNAHEASDIEVGEVGPADPQADES